MSETIESPTTETPAANPPVVVFETTAPVSVPNTPKRPRGRPKGSKNKPKPEGYVKPEKGTRAPKATKPAVTTPVVKAPVIPAAAFVAPDDIVEDESPEISAAE